jgi:tRNA pseudouridine32 synthase/23S rRNA pseudouridine746 synthase
LLQEGLASMDRVTPGGQARRPGLLLDRLLYRDALMLVLDKPAGLPVHKGPKGGPNLEDHLDALRFGLPRRPGLAHRLDRDTSGCLVLGRHRRALARLGRLFASGAVEKVYWAVVRDGPAGGRAGSSWPCASGTSSGAGGWRRMPRARRR